MMELENWFERVEKKFKELHGERSISLPFLRFMQAELKAALTSQLGLDPTELKGKLMVSHLTKPFTPSDGENVIHLLLGIDAYGMETAFYWKSVNGHKTVLPSDADFDPAQLEVRVDGIDPDLVKEYLGIQPSLKFFFESIDKNYALHVEKFTSDTVYLVIEGRPGANLEKVGTALNEFVKQWNYSREKRQDIDRKGVFHSSGVEGIDTNTLLYRIDLGSAQEGLKDILEELNQHQIATVRITSSP